MLGIGLAEDFAAKANANAKFVVSALEEMGPKALKGTGGVPTVGLQIANQLIMEGIELALKAMMLARECKPPSTHKLVRLYRTLNDTDRLFVDEAVQEAVLQSATGEVPFRLSNIATVALRGPDALGQEDPAAGYAEMDAEAFFVMLDTVWNSQNSQYLGTDPKFNARGVLRTNSRVLAGGIMVCFRLAERFGSCSGRSSTRAAPDTRHRSPATRSSGEARGGDGRPASHGNTMTITVIDYVDGVQVLDPAAENAALWHRECAVEMEIIGEGFKLLQPATDADAYKCTGCGEPIPIIRRNMPGYHVPGYDRVGES